MAVNGESPITIFLLLFSHHLRLILTSRGGAEPRNLKKLISVESIFDVKEMGAVPGCASGEGVEYIDTKLCECALLGHVRKTLYEPFAELHIAHAAAVPHPPQSFPKIRDGESLPLYQVLRWFVIIE